MKVPVFIVGCPRSGTSFLYHLLLSSGGFAEFNTQMNAFDVLEPIFGDLSIRKNKERMMREWLTSKAFTASNLDATDIEAKVMAGCNNASDFLRIIMDEVARSQGVDRWIDSTPTNIPHMPRIAQDFPDAQFIHIIRDPRDVALSLDQLGWSRPLLWDKKRSLLAAGIYWEWIVRQGRKFGAMLGSRYIETRYERLVQRPEPELKRIGEFLGCELDHVLTKQVDAGALARTLTAFPMEFLRGQFTPIGRWRSKFPAGQLRWFEALVGKYMEELGYELSHSFSNSQHSNTDHAPRIQNVLHMQTVGKSEHSTFPLDGELLRNLDR